MLHQLEEFQMAFRIAWAVWAGCVIYTYGVSPNSSSQGVRHRRADEGFARPAQVFAFVATSYFSYLHKSMKKIGAGNGDGMNSERHALRRAWWFCVWTSMLVSIIGGEYIALSRKCRPEAELVLIVAYAGTSLFMALENKLATTDLKTLQTETMVAMCDASPFPRPLSLSKARFAGTALVSLASSPRSSLSPSRLNKRLMHPPLRGAITLRATSHPTRVGASSEFMSRCRPGQMSNARQWRRQLSSSSW
jgi:hypothetical protein